VRLAERSGFSSYHRQRFREKNLTWDQKIRAGVLLGSGAKVFAPAIGNFSDFSIKNAVLSPSFWLC